MTKPYPQEFRDDVIRVARNREPGVPIVKIARDFGVHPMTLHKWLRRADIDDATTPAQSHTEATQVRELSKRNRLFEPSHRAAQPIGVCPEFYDRRSWPTGAEARIRVGDWIESRYHRRRLHSALGYVPPVEFEMNLLNKPATQTATAA